MSKKTQLGDRILTLRKAQKMTQTDLGEAVGLSKGAISQFEKSQTRPSLATLDKLSTALGEDLRPLSTHIGRFPVNSTRDNTEVALIHGKYNRLKWDYLRRDTPVAEWFVNVDEKEPFESLSLPPSLLEDGNHIVFPMPGHQFAPTFEPGDLLLLSHFPQEQWDELPADSNMYGASDAYPVCAVESQTPSDNSLHFGRVCYDREEQRLYCYYDDRSRERIPLANVKAIWKFRYVISKRAPNLKAKIRESEHEAAQQKAAAQKLQQQLEQANEVIAALQRQLQEQGSPEQA